MQILYVLIGVPGSGKSTWISNQEWATGCAIISTDKHVEEYAASRGMTYSEVFGDYMPIATALMSGDVVRARLENKDIIWDQTSTTVASRAKKFRMLPDYRRIAVVLKTPEKEELLRRLSSRPGKVVPLSVVEGMLDNWEEPTLDEFDEIWYGG